MKLLIIFFIIIPLASFSQNSDSIKARRVSIGLTFSPDYCYRTLKSNTPDFDFLVDYNNANEVPKFGFTAGVNFAFKLSERITLEAAALYSDKGEKTRKHDLNFVTPSGDPDPNPNLPRKGIFIYHYNYINVPLRLNYYFLTQKIKFYVTAGILPSIFINSKTTEYFEFADGHTKTTTLTSISKYKKLNLAFMAGLGFSYDITSRLYLKLEPIYSRSLTTIIDAPINEYLYTVGLNTGIFYKL